MNIKKSIRAITPPLVWDTAHNLKFLLKPPLSEIRFQTWAAACEAATENYASDFLTRFRAERFYLSHQKGCATPISSRPILLMTKLFGTRISITDFGGAFGEYGESLCQAFPTVQYCVVETSTVVEAAPKDGAVSFSQLPPENCDVFFTSGTLQYLDDPYAVVGSAFRSAAKAVILTRNCFSDTEMFRVQQSWLFDNGSGEIPSGFENVPVRYPIRTISESRIMQIASTFGFELLMRVIEPPAFLDDDVYSALMIFVIDR